MKRYQQVCPLARGLDVVGERWSLLVVRELMLGPRRYTDLQSGLPGIGTNILAARLKELTAAGVIMRRTLPPPAPAAVYELTEAGRELAPALDAIRQWGVAHAPPAEKGDSVRPAWVLMSAGAAPVEVAQPGTTCELHVGDDAFHLVSDESGFSVGAGPADHADATISMEPDAFYALATGRARGLAARSSSVTGSEKVATAFVSALRGAVSATAPGS